MLYPLPVLTALTPGTSVVRKSDPKGRVMTVTARSDDTSFEPVNCTVKWLETGAFAREAEVLERDLSQAWG
ncbi:MAG: hypothetical protein U0984_11650 [Prosthecobacter sp.]|nr:hypothetical protein [Prosthecobacter sp.]